MKTGDAIEYIRQLPLADQLNVALLLIQNVSAQLDTDYRVCGECDTKRYENWDDHKLANQLIGAEGRLKLVRDTLRKR